MKPLKLLFTPDFNQSIHIEADTENHTTSDTGAILIRSILDKTKILDFLVTGLEDPRDQNRIKHPLSELLVQNILTTAQGWNEMQSSLANDPALTASRNLPALQTRVREASDFKWVRNEKGGEYDFLTEDIRL